MRVAAPLLAAAAILGVLATRTGQISGQTPPAPNTYDDLIRLFREWREFQKPRMVDGVPDYSREAMNLQHQKLRGFQERLARIEIRGWPVSHKIDYNLVRAEMNGMDFDHRVLRPWSRDPSFYAVFYNSDSDVPLREGPQIYGVLEMWKYSFPLSEKDAAEVRAKLDAAPRLLQQARKNLTEDTKDLWTIGIYSKRQESGALANLARRLATPHPDLVPYAERARSAVDEFRAWMEQRNKSLKGTSAIGVENYNWYLKNVHLVPYTWQQQLDLEQRELERSLATWRLEQQHNRKLPALEAPGSIDEFRKREKEAIETFFRFLSEEEIFTVRDYMHLDPSGGPQALLPESRRDFFTQIEYRDSLPMKCHSIHWVEKQRLAREPHASPIRNAQLLYNIWDGRSEGFATAWEEVMMHAGLFDSRPRARELIYLLVAMRAVRGIADLKLHSGEFTLEQAVKYVVDTTPNGWFLAQGDTLLGDLRIYLHQPSYGTTYIIGKLDFDKLLADKSRQAGDGFRFREFMDQFFATGIIPMSMIRWEMTGLDDEARKLGLRM